VDLVSGKCFGGKVERVSGDKKNLHGNSFWWDSGAETSFKQVELKLH